MSFISLLLLLAATATAPAATDPAAALITSDALIASIETLSSPDLAGRLPGTEGYAQAARWGADRFAAAGLQPGGEDGFFQHFPMEMNDIERAELSLAGPDHQNGAWTDLALGTEFACRGFSGQGDVEAPIVFVGYGLSLPDRGYDDYAGIDVEGKIVLAFKQAPGWKPKDGEGWGQAHLPRPKAATARAHGASGLLLIAKPMDSNPQPVIASVLHGEGEHVPDLPAAQISLEAAGALAKNGLAHFKRLQDRIDRRHAPASEQLDAKARFRVEARYEPEADAVNVVGVIPGTDPALKEECVILGAHLDHVGRQGEVFWPGANDNASGAAAVVAMADAFARSGQPPARTVVFVLFAGEEQGLCGAKFNSEHPYIDLDRAAAMINLDCVAHGDSISVGGGKSQPELWAMARELDAEHAGLTIARTWRGGGADAHPYWEKGVPTLYFATKNSYTYLHQTGDTVATLNPDLYAEVVRLAYRTAREIADGNYEREEIQEAS